MPSPQTDPKPSLFRAYNLTLLGAFALAGLAAILAVNLQMRSYALEGAEAKALVLLNRNLATHHYFSSQLKPLLFEQTRPLRDQESFTPQWMSSTYAVRQIDGLFRELSGLDDYYYKEAAIDARTPANEADAAEAALLRRLNADPELTSVSRVRKIDGRPFFEVLRRGETLEPGCLRCHSTPDAAPAELVAHYGPVRSFNRRVGETIDVISIRIPLQQAYAEVNRISWQLSLILVLSLGFLGLLHFALFQRLIVRPLRRLEGFADALAGHDGRLGETLPPGRRAEGELARLTEAFNRLSTRLAESQERLERMARTDPLTGLVNRARFSELLAQEIDRSTRYREPLALLMLDIDHFKRVNDRWGHPKGDRVLKGFAATVARDLRRVDLFGRWGGEEFLVLAPNTSAESARATAERIRASVAAAAFDPVGPITVSIGVTGFAAGDSLQSLLGRVDQALYRAKHQGRDRVCVIAPA